MHRVFKRVIDIPSEWNSIIGDNIFLDISFLKVLEETQKKETEYHIFYDADGCADSVFVLFNYTDFPFFKNTILPFKRRINMIYFPIPFSRSSIIIGSKTKNEVMSVINKIKGITLICNIPETELLDFPFEQSYARCRMKLEWNSMDEYFACLRSHYRYKYLKVLKQCKELTIKLIDQGEFSMDLYKLYENVYERSDLKINKAEPRFFQSSFSRLITINTSSKCIGFVQLFENGKELVFSLIGLDYNLITQYNLYIRLMLEIIKHGIDKGYQSIDFGQTTYEVKQQLGSKIENLFIQANHNNKVILRILLLFKKFLLKTHEYSDSYNVFNTQNLKI